MSVGDDLARTRSFGQILSIRSCSICRKKWEGAAKENVERHVEGGKLKCASKNKKCVCACLSQLIADTSVELLPLHAQEVVSGLQDTALGCNGPGSVDVVSSHHSDSDPSSLALTYGVWYLKERVKTIIYVRTMYDAKRSSELLLRVKQVADVPPVLLGLQCLLRQYM